MEFLKRLSILFILLGGFQSLLAQNNITEAFDASYKAENAGDLEKAIQSLLSVYTVDFYEANLRLGWLYYQSGNMGESITKHSKAVELKPYAIEPKLGLAYPLSAMARWDEIIELYNKILSTDPQNSLTNYRLALIYYNRSQFETADTYIQKVVNLYPFDYDSVLLYAWNEFMLKRSREARVLFQKVLLIRPGDESALRGLELLK